MLKRTFLIHGYIEDPTIFDKLVPLLPLANYVPINLADEFLALATAGLIDVRLLAQYLIDHYAITSSDVVIGHSLGGWVAINIKQLCGATAIQLGLVD
jgi:pimeloyl-ACP methyl ester carboxylesterase